MNIYIGLVQIPLSMTPKIGWKFKANYFMIDLSAGYKFVVVDAYNYQKIKKYTSAGAQFGLGFKMFFENLHRNKERYHCPPYSPF
jgi:hypothetical protein